MTRRWWIVLQTSLAAVLLAPCVGHAAVVGLTESHDSFYVAVRGFAPAGTMVTGIYFYSNDSTVFPAVRLALDGQAGALPSPGETVRVVENASGRAGYVTVSFEPYRVSEGQALWAIVELPAEETLRSPGVGGGPGIGWRDEGRLTDERSLFCVNGSMGEFTPAFDVTLLVQQVSAKSGGDAPAAAEGPLQDQVQVKFEYGPRGGVLFSIGLPREADVRLDVYSITGHRIARLIDGRLSPGSHVLTWRGRDALGGKVASGIYIYKLDVGGESRSGKV